MFPTGLQLVCAYYLQGKSEAKDARACRKLAERMILRLSPQQQKVFAAWKGDRNG